MVSRQIKLTQILYQYLALFVYQLSEAGKAEDKEDKLKKKLYNAGPPTPPDQENSRGSNLS
jgi:hypothetical protein